MCTGSLSFTLSPAISLRANTNMDIRMHTAQRVVKHEPLIDSPELTEF